MQKEPRVPSGLGALQERIGTTFADVDLLQQALTHTSYTNENLEYPLPPNERLEFLGDAILDYVAADYLFVRFPRMQEGEMTALRAAMVKTSALASLARQWDLGSHLLLGKGEEASGGRSRVANLCAAFEAVIGSLYLDRGMDAVREILTPLLAAQVAALLPEEAIVGAEEGYAVKDAKSLLQELSQSRFHITPVYRTVAQSGPDHEREFTVEVVIGTVARGVGLGRSKQVSEQAAAQQALGWLASLGLGNEQTGGEPPADS